MSATAAVLPVRSCPAWCTSEADEGFGMHLGEVHEIGDLTLSLAQAPGEAPAIGVSDDFDQELSLSIEEAEQLAITLLQLARDARQARCMAAA